MVEFGDIFDYQQSAMCYECISLAFMAIYGLAIVRFVAHPKARALSYWVSSLVGAFRRPEDPVRASGS